MKKHSNFKFCLATVATAALLTACGGGSSGDTVTTFAGSVIDGYIENAKVCLDVNSNLECDSSEPSALTAADGSYSFQYSGDTAGMHVLALVTTASKDSELGPITQPFNLLAPASSPKAITPMTTLVSSDMIETKSTAAEAQQTVKASLGLSKDVLDYDFKNAGDTDMLQVAQVTATAMASAQETIKSGAGTASMTTADIVRAAVQQVKTQVLPVLVSSQGKVTVDIASAKSQEDVEAAMKTKVDIKTLVTGNIQDIVARAKSGDPLLLNMEQAFKDGLMLVEETYAMLADDQGNPYDEVGAFRTLVVEYLKFDVSKPTEAFVNQQILHTKGEDTVLKWGPKYQGSDNEVIFDGESWSKPQPTEIVSFENNCVIVSYLGAGSSTTEKVCGTKKDLVGKKITDFVPNLCEDVDNTNCNPNAVFPAGSFGVDLTFSNTQDLYMMWVDDQWSGYAESLALFPAAAAATNRFMFVGNECNVRFRGVESSYQTDASGSVVAGQLQWAESDGGCSNPTSGEYTETSNFTVEIVGGKRLLKVPTPVLYRKQNPGDTGAYLFFAEATNANGVTGVYSGDLRPANIKQTIEFTGDPSRSTQVVSQQAFDALSNEIGLPAFPY